MEYLKYITFLSHYQKFPEPQCQIHSVFYLPFHSLYLNESLLFPEFTYLLTYLEGLILVIFFCLGISHFFYKWIIQFILAHLICFSHPQIIAVGGPHFPGHLFFNNIMVTIRLLLLVGLIILIIFVIIAFHQQHHGHYQ